MIFGLLAFMVFMAVVLALWEIQIEGRDGWAANLPTWRVSRGWAVKLTGGRPLTGYHVFMTVFLIGLVHLPIFFAPWGWPLEGLLLGFYLGMVLLEDFSWFLFNPHYGLKSFRRGKVWWHRGWWGPLPAFYWVLGAVCILLFYLGWGAI